MLFYFLCLVAKPLERNFQPITVDNYDISISCEMDKEYFNGIVYISFNITKDVEMVELDSKVDIEDVYLNDKAIKVHAIEGGIQIKQNFKPGKHKLKITYRNTISDKMNGFYKSRGVIWSTHFEPADARKAFPCFDQPDMKATFKIQITAPKHLVVLSNMGVKKESVAEDRKTTEFFESPRMSTYLVAWAVGPLHYVKDGRIRVFSTQEKYKHGKFALKMANECLNYFENYFKIPYPLDKLDLLGIPEFAMGAMENWGLITFRESSLLFFEDTDPEKKSTVLAQKIIAETVCHEIAHQWYGNLVTMEWWNDIWLNEGFATWASNVAIRKTGLKWNNDLYFLDQNMIGLDHDGLLSAHPLENKDDPNQVFDSISYSKGSGILKMVEDYKNKGFREKLVEYLKDKKYKNSTTKELTTYLEVNIDTWTKKSGHPLVKVGRDGTLTQERFSFLPMKSTDVVWNIPLKIDWLNGNIEYFSFLNSSKKIELKNQNFKVNSSGVGFYRVQYEDEKMPVKLLKHGLSPLDRLNLFNDVHALVLKTTYKMQTLMDVALELVNEDKYEVLRAVTTTFESLRDKFVQKKDDFNYFIQKFTTDYSFEPSDDLNTAAIRALKVKTRQRTGDLKICRELLSKKRDPLFRASVFECMIKIKDDEESFSELLKIYETSNIPDIKNSALYALTQTANKSRAFNLFNLINDRILLQDINIIFSGLSRNYKHKNDLITYTMENWEKLKDIMADNSSLLGNVLICVFSTTPEDLKEKVLNFMTANFEGVENALKNVREAMDINTQLRNIIVIV